MLITFDERKKYNFIALLKTVCDEHLRHIAQRTIHIWCLWKLSNFQDRPPPCTSTSKIFPPPRPWTSNSNVWLSMISGHGPNPIFFKKKNREWTSRTVATCYPPPSPQPLCPITSHLGYWWYLVLVLPLSLWREKLGSDSLLDISLLNWIELNLFN